MIENEDLLKKVIDSKNQLFVLQINEKKYFIDAISIEKAKIPVRKPTTRGGVYFTDTTAYKMKVVLHDLSVKDQIPKLMLGPNTSFAPIQVSTSLKIDGTENFVTITAHLTNSVNTQERVELNLVVDGIESK